MARDCKNCKHYVVSDTKINYEQNGCGTYMQEIYSCDSWECKFEPKVIPVAEIEKILKRFELRMAPTVYIELLSDILNYEVVEDGNDD